MALPKVDDGRKTREALQDLLDDADPHLRIDVARALAEIGDVKSRALFAAGSRSISTRECGDGCARPSATSAESRSALETNSKMS